MKKVIITAAFFLAVMVISCDKHKGRGAIFIYKMKDFPPK